MKKTFTAWLNGHPLETVDSKRHFTHAIAVLDERQSPAKWGVLSWHGSESLARKAQTAQWRTVYSHQQIVGVSQRIGYFTLSAHPGH